MAAPSRHDDKAGDRWIHRLFDGELSPQERREAFGAPGEAADDGVLREKLEALGELRALVRAASESELEPLDADATWAQIAARIEGAASEELEPRTSTPRLTPAARPALRVIDGGLSERAREERPDASERTETAPPSLLERDEPVSPRDSETKKRAQQVRQRRLTVMAVTGFAAAAAAVIAFLGPADGPAPDTIATVEGPVVIEPTHDPVLEEQLHRTEVLAVDFGANVGTVFSIEGEAGSRYAVVWLSDDAIDAPPSEGSQL